MRLDLIIKKTILWLALSIIGWGLNAQPSHAQAIFNAEPFAFRAEPSRDLSSELVDPFNYLGEPIAFRSFRVLPNLTLRQEYTDNILGVEDNAQSDFITIINPEVQIQKSIGRHGFIAGLSSEIRQHWRRTEDNVENYNAFFDGNFEVRKKLNIPIRVGFRNAHLRRTAQRRASANQIVENPLNVQRFDTETGFIYTPNRLSFSLLGNYAQVRLENGTLIGGGLLTRDNRDVNITGVSGEVSYDIKNGLSPFVRLDYASENFINETPNSITRNNDTIGFLSGFKLGYKGLVRGFVGLGIENKLYEDSAVDDITNLAFDADINWDPTEKTRLSFNAKRSTTEDNIFLSSLTSTQFRTGIQHEIQKDIFGRTSITYMTENFDDFDRTDRNFDIEFELLKTVNPKLQYGATYTYLTRNSSLSGLGLNNNILSLNAKLAF